MTEVEVVGEQRTACGSSAAIGSVGRTNHGEYSREWGEARTTVGARQQFSSDNNP